MNKFSTLFTLLILTFEIAFAGQIINKSSGKPVRENRSQHQRGGFGGEIV